jgi:hypothetical protein
MALGPCTQRQPGSVGLCAALPKHAGATAQKHPRSPIRTRDPHGRRVCTCSIRPHARRGTNHARTWRPWDSAALELAPDAAARLSLASWCRAVDPLHKGDGADAAAALALIDSLERTLDMPRRLCERAVAADCAAVMARIDKLAAHALLDPQCDKARLLSACAAAAQAHPTLQEYLAERGPDGEWLPRHAQLLSALQTAAEDEKITRSVPAFVGLAHSQNALRLYCDAVWERLTRCELPDHMRPEEVMLLVSNAVDVAARDSAAEFRIIHGIYGVASDFDLDLAVYRASCDMDAGVLAKTLLALGALNKSWTFSGRTYPRDATIVALLEAVDRTCDSMCASEAASTMWALTALAHSWAERDLDEDDPELSRTGSLELGVLQTLKETISCSNVTLWDMLRVLDVVIDRECKGAEDTDFELSLFSEYSTTCTIFDTLARGGATSSQDAGRS